MKLLTVVKRVGDRLFFADNTSVPDRGHLYPMAIDTTEEFKKLLLTFKEVDEVNSKSIKLQNKRTELINNSDKLVEKIKKVNVTI